jgi:4-amino-4-deoxy-L-arabinose transferase-like glycosyltransferase
VRLLKLPLFYLLLAAAALRFYRLDFDLPQGAYIDSLRFVDQAARMAGEGTLRPTEFLYPGLFTGLLAAVYKLIGADSPYVCHLTARVLSASFAVGLVWATWAMTARIGLEAARFIAAALAATCVVSISYARLATADSAMLFLLTAGLSVLAGRSRSPWSYAWAGLLIGLSAGSKYTGFIGLPFLVFAALAAAWWHQDRLTAYLGVPLGLAAAAAAFLATTPYLLVTPESYLQRFSLETVIQSAGQIGEIQLDWTDYLWSKTPVWEAPWLGTSLAANLGPTLLAAAALSTLAALSGLFGFLPFFYASFAAVYLASASRPGHLKAARFLLPALPCLYALTGWAAERFLLSNLRRARRAALPAVCLALLAVPSWKCAAYLRKLHTPSTNTLALGWMSSHVLKGSLVFMSPFFTHNLYELPLRFVQQSGMAARIYRLPEGPNPERDPVYHADLADSLRKAGVRYLVFNSYFDGAFAPTAENLRWFPNSIRNYEAFMARVKERAQLVYSVQGESAGRFGPDIEVFRFVQ